MPDLNSIPQLVRNLILSRPVEVNITAPWTNPSKPLTSGKVAIVTSAGVHTKQDTPFARNDSSFRRIGGDVDPRDLIQSHSSIGFDRTAFMLDPNVVFPLERLRSLEAAGYIGSVASTHYSFMGAQTDVSPIKNETSWMVAEALVADHVDFVVLTPSCPVCTSTTSVIARNLEESRLTTVALSLVRPHSEKILPPRVLYVPYPFGSPLGRPNDEAGQLAVLREALSMLELQEGPALHDFDDETATDLVGTPVRASQVTNSTTGDLATEMSMMRGYWRARFDSEGRSAVGLSGIEPEKFRGVVRYLESVRDNGAYRRPGPTDKPEADAIRHMVDDLRALYMEARFYTHPSECADDRQTWFWGETALGRFLPELATSMKESENAAIVEAAHGIAR